MKKLLFALLMIVAANARADNAKLVIKQKSGNETVLALSTNPVITFAGENMKIENEYINISLPMEDVDEYRIDNPDHIEQLSNTPKVSKGHVTFTGIPKSATGYVYNTEGKTICTQKANDDGTMEFNIDALPKGTYIVKASNNTIKVTTK